MHGIGQFILEVITFLLEYLPRKVHGFQRGTHTNGNGPSLMVSVDTDNACALFTCTHSFSYCGPCSSIVMVFIRMWPLLTGHMPGMTSTAGIWKKPTISLDKVRL